MNFQAVSVGEKLPVGGYKPADAGTAVPSTLLAGALAHVDASLGKMVTELTNKGLLNSTLIIVSAKHGQSPIDRSTLHMESGGFGTADVVDPLVPINTVDVNVDGVWSTFTNPNSGNPYAVSGHMMADDVGLVWLQDQSSSNVSGVLTALQNAATTIEANVLPSGTIFTSNITSGTALTAVYGDPTSTDPVASARAPNIFIQPNHGVIYSGSSKKIAEHGGGTTDDTNVLLLVSMPGLKTAQTVSTSVATTQVAPTILQALGIAPTQLQGVQKEGTAVLPSLF
jgi:predicted AlkP superfamily pyrophosphatase or phosphodiesterase